MGVTKGLLMEVITRHIYTKGDSLRERLWQAGEIARICREEELKRYPFNGFVSDKAMVNKAASNPPL